MSAEQTTDNNEKVTVANDVVTKDYLIKILEHHHHNNKVDLINYSIESAAGKGENYASVILRGKLEYTISDGIDDDVKRLSVIIKTKSGNAEVDEFLEDQNVFKKEAATYVDILSETERLLQSHGDCTLFSPELIFADDKAIVLEDLAERGYRTQNRIDRLDLVHSKALLVKLAKYHAATSTMYQQKQGIFKYHVRSPLGDTESILDFFYQNSMKELIGIVAVTPGLQKYAKQLEQFAENVIDKEKDIYKSVGSYFTVLNHGDLWINNTLWKHNATGGVEDVLLVDHQEGQVCSPGLDLNHFLLTSCNLEVLVRHYDELVAHYHEELSNTLQVLGVKAIPTLEDINEEIRSAASHGVLVTAAITPILLIENQEFANALILLSDSEEGRYARQQVYSNPKYVAVLEYLIPKFAKEEVI